MNAIPYLVIVPYLKMRKVIGYIESLPLVCLFINARTDLDDIKKSGVVKSVHIFIERI
jgi:hypothetical protein